MSQMAPQSTVVGIDFLKPAHVVAPQLIGLTLLVNGVGGVIVETEAYDRADPASHSFGGQTQRNSAMFGPPATVYVYRSYGMHWCLNFVCCETGHGAGVLIRALEPVFGIDKMRHRRAKENLRLLCSGPGRLTQALGVDANFTGLSLEGPAIILLKGLGEQILVSPGRRVGISKAVDIPWRFCSAGSTYLSKPIR